MPSAEGHYRGQFVLKSALFAIADVASGYLRKVRSLVLEAELTRQHMIADDRRVRRGAVGTRLTYVSLAHLTRQTPTARP